MNKEKAYVLDTNILFNMAIYHLDNQDNNWRVRKAKEFYSKAGERIYILDLVWAEFLGSFLHKNIDFNKYQLWYRNRRTAIEKMYASLVKNNASYIGIGDSKKYNKLFELTRKFSNSIHSNKIAQKINKYDKDILKEKIRQAELKANLRVKNNLERTLKRINEETRKIFDGIDAAVAVYAYLISKADESNDVILITEDKSLEVAVDYCYKNKYKFFEGGKWNVRAMGLNKVLRQIEKDKIFDL